MADECTDISNVEEVSVCCRWVENGKLTEHFLNILPLKRTNAGSINFILLLLNVLAMKPFSSLISLAWGLMTPLLLLGRNQVFKQGQKKHALMLYLFTDIAISFSWPTCRLQMVHKECLCHTYHIVEILPLLCFSEWSPEAYGSRLICECVCVCVTLFCRFLDEP